MFAELQRFTDSIFNCKNVFEIEKFIENDKHACIMKGFDSEYVFMKILQPAEYPDQIVHCGIYVNFKDKSTSIDYPCSFKDANLEEDFVKMEINSQNELEVTYKDFKVINRMEFTYPIGKNYMIEIKDGYSGRGESWTKTMLGLG